MEIEKKLWDYFHTYDVNSMQKMLEEATSEGLVVEETYQKQSYLLEAFSNVMQATGAPFVGLGRKLDREERKEETRENLKREIQKLLETNKLSKEEEKRLCLFWKYLG